MKYIKLFEAFALPEKVVYEKKEQNNIVIYITYIKDIKFIISFYKKDDSYYERVYNSSDSNDFETFDNLAKLIVSTITYITNEFIKEYNPNVIEISHISTKKKDENGILHSVENRGDILNKRARINYLYLSQLEPIKKGIYKINYYPGYYSTDCFIYKPAFRIFIGHHYETPIDPTKK
jgi:hypothetical protein